MIIDVHIHCALSGVGRLKKNLMQSDTPERRNWFNSLLARYKKANVFALRDGGDAYSAGIYFKPIVQDQGIIYKTPIRALYKKGQYGDFLGVGLTGIDSCRAEMNQLLKEKPDFIKIVQSGIMSFEDFGYAGDVQFTKEELNYLIARAHDAGLKTMVHVNSPKGIMMALEAGADSIEHAYGIDDECIEAFTEKNCIWVPTLAPFANIADCDGKHALSKYKKVSERYFKEHCAQVKKAHEKGVSIALGSDSGASLVLHARGCYDELKYLNQCGLDEIELFNNCCKVMDLNKKTINC